MKKIIALILTLTLLATMLVSCVETAESLEKKALKKLEKNAYTVDIEYDINTDNELYAPYLSALAVSGTMEYDGESYRIVNEIAGFETEVIIIGNTAYMTATGDKKKAELTDEEMEYALGEYGRITPDFFETVELTEDDGVYTLTCTNVVEDEKLAQMMNIDEESSQVDWENTVYVVTYEDGAYSEQSLTLPVTVSVAGVSFSYTLEVTFEYDYDSKVDPIKAPDNADSYTECDYEDIFG